MAKQTISLCVITKNEEKYLERCLDSVKGIVDEIIIVDTGSTDKTKEIAKKFKSKVFGFKWNDDFSAARNESLKYASKEWILVLDADEMLDEDGRKQIIDLINDKNVDSDKVDAFMLIQKNYTNQSSIAGFAREEHKQGNDTYAGWYGSFICRLFRNKKGFEFKGAVHELAEPSIEEKKGKIAATKIALHHYGNTDPEKVAVKKKKYLELAKRKVKEMPDAFSYFELGILQRENDDIEGAIKSLKKSVDIDPGNMAFFELGVCHQQQKDYGNAIENYTKSLRIKENSDAFQNLGICCLKTGKTKEAYRNLVKAMMLNPNKYSIYNNLGAVLEKTGNFDNAIQMLEIGIKLNPKNAIGHHNLAVVYGKKGELQQALRHYDAAVELNHPRKEEIKKQIVKLKQVIANVPGYGKYNYKFGVGG